MSKIRALQPSEPSVSSGTSKEAVDPYAQITAAAKRVSSTARFYAESVTCVVRAFSAPYGAIHARFGAEIVDHEEHSGSGDPRFWKGTVHEFLTASLTDPKPHARMLRARSGKAQVALLSAPIYSPAGSSVGAMAIVVPVTDELEWASKLASFESLCRFISAATEFVGQGDVGRAASSSGSTGEQAMSRASACESAEQFAFSITNELRNKLDLEQVAIGVKHRSSAKILSISGLDQVSAKSPGVVALRSAMEECLDAGEAITFQRGAQWGEAAERPLYLLHKQWHGAANGDAVASIPLCEDGETVAVLSLRSRADQPLTDKKIELIRKRVQPIIPALLLTQRATRGIRQHVLDVVQHTYDGMLSPGGLGRKITTLLVVLAGMVFAFGSMNYDLSAACKVTPAVLRHLTAPFEGRLAVSHVVAGDPVTAGQVLAELDTRDLVQQRVELEAQWQVHERERDRALAFNKPSDAQVALANRKLIEAKLEIADRRIQQASILAPFDGIVVEGDLRTSVGMVLGKGEPLFRVGKTTAVMINNPPIVGVPRLT